MREQAQALRQLESGADNEMLTLHRDAPVAAPVRTPQMQHDLALRWAAAQVGLQVRRDRNRRFQKQKI